MKAGRRGQQLDQLQQATATASASTSQQLDHLVTADHQLDIRRGGHFQQAQQLDSLQQIRHDPAQQIAPADSSV